MAGHLPTYRLYTSLDPAFPGSQPRLAGKTALRLGFGGGAILFLLLGYTRHGWRRSMWLLVLLAVVCLAAACSEDIEDSSSTSVGSLQSGQTYYWKVVADYGDGIEATSKTRSFSVR